MNLWTDRLTIRKYQLRNRLKVFENVNFVKKWVKTLSKNGARIFISAHFKFQKYQGRNKNMLLFENYFSAKNYFSKFQIYKIDSKAPSSTSSMNPKQFITDPLRDIKFLRHIHWVTKRMIRISGYIIGRKEAFRRRIIAVMLKFGEFMPREL